MKKFLLIIVLLAANIAASLQSSQAQTISSEMERINEIFKKSVFKTRWYIDKDGQLTRIDKSKNTFNFNLLNVKEIFYKYDGNHNLYFKMKDGFIVHGKTNYGLTTRIPYNIVGFKKKEDYDSAYKHFLLLDSLYKAKADSINKSQ